MQFPLCPSHKTVIINDKPTCDFAIVKPSQTILNPHKRHEHGGLKGPNTWRFPKIGVPPFIIQILIGIFHSKPSSYGGTPMESPIFPRSAGASSRLKIFEDVDLLTPGAFDAAIAGCGAVLHTASPFYMAGGSEMGMDEFWRYLYSYIYICNIYIYIIHINSDILNSVSF